MRKPSTIEMEEPEPRCIFEHAEFYGGSDEPLYTCVHGKTLTLTVARQILGFPPEPSTMPAQSQAA